MKPLRLEMRAFGPYANRQVLDFADLKGRRFFLIHGPTGSGKTTVLDAMAFALYGHTSGAERDAADMRSDQAAPDALTEVTFDFAIGAHRYRAWRRPAQERPKLRGEGVTIELQDATLWRLKSADAGGDSAPTAGSNAGAEDDGALATDGKPLAAGWTKVTAKAVEILGFRAEQFRQVVMLPQGRFQELLKADSAGRADILATLFGTQYYARLERELKDAAAAARKALDHVAQQRGFVLAAADLDSEDELAPARERIEEAFALACEERVRRDEARSEAEADERAAVDVIAKLDTAREAQGALSVLQARQPEIARLREEERLARAAAAVSATGRRAHDCAEVAAAAEGALTEAADLRDEATAAHERAAKALADETGRAAERADAQRRVADLEALRARIAPLTDARRELELAEADHACASGILLKARAALDGARADHSAAAEAQQQARAAVAGADGHTACAENARATANERASLELLQAQLADAELRCRAADGRLRGAVAAWQRACELSERVEREWSAGQAAVLARSLKTGVACPVCGSTEHPAPADVEAPGPGSEQLAAAREAAAAALAHRDAAGAEHSEATASRTALLTLVEAACARLGSHAHRSPRECVADAEAAAILAAASREAADKLPALDEALRAAQEAVVATEQLLTAAQADADSTGIRRTHAAALVDERTAGLPDGLSDTEPLEREIAAAIAAAAALAESYAAAQAADRETAVALSSAQARAAAAEKTLRVAVESAQAASAALGAELVTHGFGSDAGEPDLAGWRAAVRSDDGLEQIVAAARAFDDELAAARGRAEQAAAAATGLEPPDLATLRSRAESARRESEDAATTAAQLQLRLGSLADTAAQLAELRCQNESLDARYSVVGHMAKLANGDNPSGLTLQRFVLGALLDTVLLAATARLKSMSKGRYQLLRTDERRGGKRAAGLDMDVYDAWTGKSRPVSTLSGGESFLAALSLALGLAETVQARTGGIFLDTVFVDEGFGTLDDEALDLAIATLMQLQEGDRLVGIISHVAELKERIDARLEVIAERGVSRARFVVP